MSTPVDPRDEAIAALRKAVQQLESINERLEEENRASKAMPAELRRELHRCADLCTTGETRRERLLAASLLVALVRNRIPAPGPVSVRKHSVAVEKETSAC